MRLELQIKKTTAIKKCSFMYQYEKNEDTFCEMIITNTDFGRISPTRKHL